MREANNRPHYVLRLAGQFKDSERGIVKIDHDYKFFLQTGRNTYRYSCSPISQLPFDAQLARLAKHCGISLTKQGNYR